MTQPASEVEQELRKSSGKLVAPHLSDWPKSGRFAKLCGRATLIGQSHGGRYMKRFREILLFLPEGPGARGILARAVELAKRNRACLTGVEVGGLPRELRIGNGGSGWAP